MKFLRLASFAGAVVAALLLGLAALAFDSGFQTWAAQRLLAERPSLHVSIGAVGIGLEHVHLENLRIERGGVVLTIPSVDIDIAVVPAIWNRDLRVRGAWARGWTPDASGVPLNPAQRAMLGEPFASPEVDLLGCALTFHRKIPGRIHGFDLAQIPDWDRLDLQGQVVLPSGAARQDKPLTVELTGSPTTTGAAYSVDMDSGALRFAELRAHWTADVQRLYGRWKVDLDVGGVRSISTRGEGSFETAQAGLHVEGRLVAGASGLAGVLLPRYPATALSVAARFDVVGSGVDWRVNQLEAELDAGDPVLEVTALQAFELNPATREVRLADPGKDLASISIRSLPLAWIRPWIRPMDFSGRGLCGELVATTSGGGLELRSLAPLSIAGFSASGYGRTFLDGVDVVADATAELRPGGWQVKLAPLRVSSGAAQLVALHMKIGKLAGEGQPLEVEGRLVAGLPALFSHAGHARPIDLVAGNLDCMFAGTLGREVGTAAKLEAQVAVTGLQAGARILPTVSAEVRADLGSDGRVALRAPVRMDLAGRSSDVTLSGTLARTPAGCAVDLQAAAGRLFIDDARVLAAPFALYSRREPFWKGTTGRLAFSVKRASWPGDFEVGDLGGSLLFGPDAIRFIGVHGDLDGGKVELDGVLSPGAAPPSGLGFHADVNLEDFDFAPFFGALDPDRPPTLEGRFDAKGMLTGTPGDLMHLPGRFRGEWHLTSKGGVFRPLAEAVAVKAAAPGKIAVIGQFIGTVADTVTFRKDARNAAKKADAVAEFSRSVTAIRYDRIDIALRRDDSMNFAIDDFSLISPEIRIDGMGGVLAEPGTALLAEPLALDLNLRARGHAADLLRTAGLLAAARDDLGYSACTLPFDIVGTASNPDMDDFRNSLLKLIP
jgi:hypothetical protein